MAYNNNGNGTYRNSGANRNSGNDGQDKKQTTGAKFRIRGLVCKNSKTGEAFTNVNTKNNTPMCYFTILSNHFENKEQKRDYYNMTAFGDVADKFMRTAKVHCTVDAIGYFYPAEYNGEKIMRFVLESFSILSEPKDNAGSGGGYQQRNSGGYSGGNGQQNRQRTYSYEQRPDNRSNEQQSGEQGRNGGRPNSGADYRRNETPPAEYDNGGDFADGSGDEDIPF